MDDEHGTLRIGRVSPRSLELTRGAGKTHRLPWLGRRGSSWSCRGRRWRGRCTCGRLLAAITAGSQQSSSTAHAEPEKSQPAQCLPPGEQSIHEVLSHLAHEVVTQRHVNLLVVVERSRLRKCAYCLKGGATETRSGRSPTVPSKGRDPRGPRF